MTRAMVLKIRTMIVTRELKGLTSVAILGSIGVLREDEVFDDR